MVICLSKREIQVLLHLLSLEEGITTKQLAEIFQVSVRTIKYDLENIREWLTEQNVELQTRRNKGIWLELPDSTRMTLKNEVLNVERFKTYPSQDIRQDKLLFSLLTIKETTSYELARLLSVSRNTIVNDLSAIEELLQQYELTLYTKSGQGVSIQGAEAQIRLLMEYLLSKEVTEHDVYQMMHQLTSYDETRQIYGILHIAKETIFQEIHEISVKAMMSLLQERNFEWNYAEILSITLRTAIAATRMRLSETIGGYKVLAKQQNDLPYQLMKEVFECVELPLLSDEYSYIYSDLTEQYREKDIAKVTKELIDEVSQTMNLPFDEDTQLFTNLFAHLSLRLAKKYQFINEYNPFVEDIKAKYPQIFLAISRAAKKMIVNSALILNDSFLAYIALHFLVAYEKTERKNFIVQAVYVCSTGLGVTSLIEQKMSEEISNIEMVGFASVMEVQKVLEEKKPDLVLSIFPIENLNCSFIQVSPLPTKEDITLIQKEVDRLLDEKRLRDEPRLLPKKKEVRLPKLQEESKEVLIRSYYVYADLLQLFGEKLVSEYKEAFLLHVMLMTHRIMFESQYEQDSGFDDLSQAMKEKIQAVFKKNDLFINQAEIAALMNYVRSEK